MDTQKKLFNISKSSKVQMSPEECEKLCKSIGLKYESGYESRVLQYTLVDESVDRHGDIVRVAGANLKQYMRNPVVMTFHHYSQFPIGNAIKTWIDKENKKVMAHILFFDDRVDKTGLSDTAFRFAEAGAMKTGSIGFIPKKSRKPTNEEVKELGISEYGTVYDQWELLEFSIVPLPANPNASTNDFEEVKKGFTKDVLADCNRLFTRDAFDELLAKINTLSITDDSTDDSTDDVLDTTDAVLDTTDDVLDDVSEKAFVDMSEKAFECSKQIEDLTNCIRALSDVVRSLSTEIASRSNQPAETDDVYGDLMKDIDEARKAFKS